MSEFHQAFWENRQVLVTGAGGFIGSWLVQTLCENGAHVRAFVRYNSRSDSGLLSELPAKMLGQIEVIAGDLRDKDAVFRAVRGMDTVFHLGALISIPYSYKNPHDVIETNVMGTVNVLLATREHGVRRVVQTSTSEVYGSARIVPIPESHPLQAQSPYSASKIASDKIAESFYCAFDTPVNILRPFNTFGPRQSARAVIPTIISQVLTQPEIHLGNLSTKRDFTYVLDTVEGFLCAAEATEAGLTVHLGTGEEVEIGDLVKRIQTIAGTNLPVIVDSDRLRPEKSEVTRLISDPSNAKAILGWEPATSLDEGLEATINWIKENPQRYQPRKYLF